jgi:ABC-type phosphate transport system substrate-binding protein
MKRITTILILILLVFHKAAYSQDNSNSIYVSGEKFTYPLLEQWVTAYTIANPDSKIKLLPKKPGDILPEVELSAEIPGANSRAGENNTFYVGRYTLVPAANRNNPLFLDRRKIKKQELVSLYFESSITDEEQTKQQKATKNIVVYSRENHAQTSKIFSNFYGFEASELKGKKISGDDIYLVSAIKKDTFGITFNSLGNLYDLKSRNLKDGIAILPLDVKADKNNRQISSNIDETIELLENTNQDILPVGNLSLTINTTSNRETEILKFLNWILTEGQIYNHGYGFLNLKGDVISTQLNSISGQLLSAK